MKVSVRVCIEDLKQAGIIREDLLPQKGSWHQQNFWWTVPAARLFDIGLRAARQDPSLIAAVHLGRKKTIATTIRITCEQFWHMKNIGLRPRETIEIGICQVRPRLTAPQ